MATTEDVLLMVPHVRYKKNDGTIYLMNERLGWMMQSRSTFAVSHQYSDIKRNLNILYDKMVLFNPLGAAAQCKDRDSIKETLQQLLPKFKKAVNKELEEKNRLLSENPQLLQLYKELVISQVISAEEFWSEHATPYIKNQLDASKQNVGVSSAFLADIKPQTDGCNGLRYNLTSDLIQSIFNTYPSVRQKHLEAVPHKLSESEFWTKFFHSHYFHRDRLSIDKKDVFTDCAKMDEQIMKKDLEASSGDPLMDVSALHDINSEDTPNGTKGSSNISIQNMIRRFNQHSIMILKASSQKPESVKDVDEQPVNKKAKLQEKLTYDDLSGETGDGGAKLSLDRVERYLHGPTKANEETNGKLSNDSHSHSEFVQQSIQKWTNSGPVVPISSSTAIKVLGDLSVGGNDAKAILDYYEHGFYDEKFLWVVPSEKLFRFLKQQLDDREIDRLVSIGCGSGLLEWLLGRLTGLKVTGYEVDPDWWNSKYAPFKFLSLEFADQDRIPIIEGNSALLFCYFHSSSAFEEYLRKFRGKVVVIVGPKEGSGRFCQVNPMILSDKSDWKLCVCYSMPRDDIMTLYEKL
nr:EOG090X04EN [Triops cancriformis]